MENREQFADLVVYVEARPFRLHRVIMVQMSRYFRAALGNFIEGREQELTLSGFSAQSFSIIVDALYQSIQQMVPLTINKAIKHPFATFEEYRSTMELVDYLGIDYLLYWSNPPKILTAEQQEEYIEIINRCYQSDKSQKRWRAMHLIGRITLYELVDNIEPDLMAVMFKLPPNIDLIKSDKVRGPLVLLEKMNWRYMSMICKSIKAEQLDVESLCQRIPAFKIGYWRSLMKRNSEEIEASTPLYLIVLSQLRSRDELLRTNVNRVLINYSGIGQLADKLLKIPNPTIIEDGRWTIISLGDGEFEAIDDHSRRVRDQIEDD